MIRRTRARREDVINKTSEMARCVRSHTEYLEVRLAHPHPGRRVREVRRLPGRPAVFLVVCSYAHDDSHHISSGCLYSIFFHLLSSTDAFYHSSAPVGSGYRNTRHKSRVACPTAFNSFPRRSQELYFVLHRCSSGETKSCFESPHNCQRRSRKHRHPDVLGSRPSLDYLFSAI
jgi:hypothetical protein